MPSSFAIFHFSPNFHARVRSIAVLRRHIQTQQMVCFLHNGPLAVSVLPSLADVPEFRNREILSKDVLSVLKRFLIKLLT
jgi:hypothetical protein